MKVTWHPGLRTFMRVMRRPLARRWRLEPAVLGFSTRELVSPFGCRRPFRMRGKVEIGKVTHN